MNNVSDSFSFSANGGSFLLTCENGGFRIRSVLPDGSLSDGAAQILARDLSETVPDASLPLTRSEKDGETLFSAACGSALFRENGEIVFFSATGEEKTALVSLTGGKSSFRLRDGERVFGTGERFDSLDQRGRRVEIYAIDYWLHTSGNSYVPIPFALSSRVCGVFSNRNEHTVMDIGCTDSSLLTFETPDTPTDLYVFPAEKPSEILFSMAELCGHCEKPADWLYGIFVCRYAPDFSTSAGVYEMARRMKDADLPWDGVILESWDTYDKSKWGELASLTAALHDAGKKVLVYQAAGRNPYPGKDKNVTLKTSDGVCDAGSDSLPDTTTYNPADCPGERRSTYVDLTSNAARDWWFDGVYGDLCGKIGIDGAKIDFCEQFPDHVKLQFADGRTEAGAHQWYPTLYNVLMYRAFCRHRPSGGMNFSRGGGIGSGRYPFLWAGDQLREWFYLEAILKGTLSAGMSGIPFLVHDLAAYRPANDPAANPEPAVFLAGAYLACFSPDMQTHGLVTRPYDFDSETVRIYRRICRIHQALRPYLTEQGEISCRTGMPLQRHPFLVCPDDRRYDSVCDCYFFGEGLFIAPVLSGKGARDVLLPRGKWQDIFTGAVFDGGVTLRGHVCPPDRCPAFRELSFRSPGLSAALSSVSSILAEN